MNIIFTEQSLKDLKKLDKKTTNHILNKIENLKNFPSITNIKKLTNFYPPYRYRIADYRVLLDIENENIIIFKIVHRKDAY